MTSALPVKTAQFVVKLSKYCNLRCTYCYEYLELGNKERMSLERLRRFFANAAAYADQNGIRSLSFIWHGGEPFLIPLDFYEEIRRLQDEAFGERIAVVNSVQTNLTVLTDRHVEVLRQGRIFRGIGMSFDVYGNQRVDTKGALRTDAILGNMQKLIDNRIPFGAIAVLARNTLPYAAEIYKFYDRLKIESRFLPFYMSAGDGQVSAHALTGREITDALKALFDCWMVSETATPVDPIGEYIDYAVAWMAGAPKSRYDKLAQEFVYIVNVDGGTWGVAEAYDPAYCYGNVFEQELAAVFQSPVRRRAAHESAQRMQTYCAQCPYFGSCPGFFVGDATPEQQRLLADFGCPVREVIDHMVGRLEKTEIKDALLSAGAPKTENPALQVSL
ncbi:MAG TPA: radical SAM protein [Stellaceae bacterium]|nr:radical SAM protein [Stellaceae bacterium]